jgi:hypothetical protein
MVSFRIMPAVRRFWLAILMNLLVPGTGLIALGRVWLGLAVALWFGLGAEVAICGSVLAPMSLPRWVTLTGGGLALAAWLAGQGLLIGRIRLLRDPNLPAELQALRDLAEKALARGEFAAAQSPLRVALSIDDADVPTRVLWARLLTQTGRTARARRAWLEAQQLDIQQRYSAEIRQALDQL